MRPNTVKRKIDTCFIIAAFLLLPAVASLSASPSVENILDNGPASKRINIVFLSEGYVDEELQKFLDDAHNLLDYLLTVSPYDRYRNYFNAFAISVASNESGSTHPSLEIYRDTYFQSTFDSFNIRRLLTLSAEGTQKAFQLLMQFVPEYDIVVVVVNDPEYGGSGGQISITSVHPQAREIVSHEIGHSFAGLTDEYETEFPGLIPRELPNATSETRREHVKWRNWFLPDTPIPTPPTPSYNHVVGLFEGAQYHSTGWYRPKFNCKMRSLGVPFCEVCVEYHIRSVYNLVSPIDEFFPEEKDITLVDGNDEIVLGITPMDQTANELLIRWYINGTGVDVPDTTHTVTIIASDLQAQSNTITVRVIDTTDLVRDDVILPLLVDEISWYITITGITEIPIVSFGLYQNYPNPFNPSTVIRFSLPQRHNVRLDLFNSLGQMVGQLIDEEFQHGYHEVTFDASHLTSGVYIYRMWAGEYVESKKLLLLK